MNIILCGMPKSGKTTVGKRLAHVLGWNFIDTDQMLVETFGLSCRELFLQHGESYFRKMEGQQIASLKGLKQHVISLGGGALLDPENVNHLQSFGHLVYLKVPLETLWKRNCENGIPAFISSENAFKELEKKRLPVYERYATTHIDAHQFTVDEVVKAILDR